VAVRAAPVAVRAAARPGVLQLREARPVQRAGTPPVAEVSAEEEAAAAE
jgi:hypothetical protein